MSAGSLILALMHKPQEELERLGDEDIDRLATEHRIPRQWAHWYIEVEKNYFGRGQTK